MADLETDLRRGGTNWFESGGTYDPFLCGPEQPLGPHYVAPSLPISDEPLESKTAIAVHVLTWIAFAVVTVAIVFFFEPLAAIFFR